MSRKIEPNDLEEIDRLIRNEVGEALAKFRAGDFEGRVRGRIAATKRPAKGILFLLKIAVPAAAILLLAVVAGVDLFDPRPAPGPAPIDPGDFAAVLSRLPSFLAPASEQAPRPSGKPALSEAGRAFATVIGSVGGGGQGEKGAEEENLARGPSPRVVPFTMKKRMEILFKDKVIERVLMSLTDRSKEA